MTKPQIIIGIDPDVDKSGLAIYNRKTKAIRLLSLTFPEMIDFLRTCPDNYPDVLIVVEAGWLNKSNWHIRKGDNIRTVQVKGNHAGRNHETGRKIIEMARYYRLNVVEQKPLRKCWKGPDRKITHEELYSLTEIDRDTIPSRTNQEERDALLLTIANI